MVELRELAPSHYDIVAAWLSRPETNIWFVAWRGKTIEPRMIAVFDMNPRNKLFIVYVDDLAAGLVALRNLDPAQGSAELWYLLGDLQFAGQGIITKAVALIVAEAFSSLELRTIDAEVLATNIGSIKILERNKFRGMGVLRDGAIREDEDAPSIGYKLQKDWL